MLALFSALLLFLTSHTHLGGASPLLPTNKVSEDYHPDYRSRSYYTVETEDLLDDGYDYTYIENYEVKDYDEGEIARLKCRMPEDKETQGLGISATWFFNGTLLNVSGPRIKLLIKRKPFGVRIRNVKFSDAGEYACQWNSDDGDSGWFNYTVYVSPKRDYLIPQALRAQELIKEEEVNVTNRPPSFDKEIKSDHVVLPAGNVIDLRCSVKGENMTITWLKNGDPPKRELGEVKIKGATLKMKNIIPNDSGNYTCIVSNQYGSINRTFNVKVMEHIAYRPIFVKNLENATAALGESVSMDVELHLVNTPTPFIVWCKDLPVNISDVNEHLIDIEYLEDLNCKDGKNITTEDPQVLHIDNVKKDDEGWYTCIAANSLGTSYSTAYLKVVDSIPTHAKSSLSTVMLCLFIVLGGIVASGFLVLVWHHYKRPPKPTAYKNKKQVIITSKENEPLLTTLRVEIYPSKVPLNSANTSNKSEYELPLDSSWEIDRSDLVMGETLGEGAFGKVFKATLISPQDPPKTVAVKMLKDNHTDLEMIDLVAEMEVLKGVGKHNNIINLIGCCTQNGPLKVVQEFAMHGNLRDYLRSNRLCSGYERPIGQEPTILSLKDLVSFAYQVSKGMDYLSSIKYVHRDLAARNVLVCEGLVLKIADFGLARDVHMQDYYRKINEGKLPVKWMAPESLFDRVYTSQSDVWSFGILLWEIFTLGGTPYHSVPDVKGLFQILREGHRMEKPCNCPIEIYTLMRECWRYDPFERPTFRILVVKLDKIYSSATQEEYLVFTTLPLETPPSSCDSAVNMYLRD